MRIRNILAALPTLAISMVLWKHAEWISDPANYDGQDGSCLGLEDLISRFLSLCFLVLSILVMVSRSISRVLSRIVSGLGSPPVLHPHRGPIDLGQGGAGPSSSPEDADALFP
jgi:hypothetical protein